MLGLILIESQWNLKRLQAEVGSRRIDINRITVEFKVVYRLANISFNLILIESQWNLKSFVHSKNLDRESILIESQWNLKKN